jgi:hypothetical protein
VETGARRGNIIELGINILNSYAADRAVMEEENT